MSIATEIERLQNAKISIKSAIEGKGVEVGNGTIDTYADKIKQISSGSVLLEELNIKPSLEEQKYEGAYGKVNVESGKTLYDNGVKNEQDRFWDNFQDYGNRNHYHSCFETNYWSDDLYNPQYDILCNKDASSGTGVFYDNRVITDTKVAIIVENSNIDTMFTRCSKLKTIRLLRVNGLEKTSSAFAGCNELENLTMEGELTLTMSVPSPVLTKASITSVVNVLSTTASGKTLTLSKTAVNKAFETSEGANDGSTSSEWLTLRATKSNWTVTLS